MTDIEAIDDLHLLQNRFHGGGPDDHDLALGVGRLLLDEDEQGLEDRVREARADVDEFDQALEVVQDDQGQGRLVGVLEDTYDLVDLPLLRVAHEVLRGDHLYIGEVALEG